MRLQGVVEIGVGPSRVRAGLNDPTMLQALMPGDCVVSAAGGGVFDFTLKKALGFLELSQAGQFRISDLGADQTRMAIQASHVIGGSVVVDLTVTLTPQDAGTLIGYDGTVEAGGLAGRVLRDRELQVRPYVKKVFERLAARIEAEPSPKG